MKKVILMIIAILFYPITYLYLMSNVKSGTKKSIISLFVYVLLFGIWCMGFFTVYGNAADNQQTEVEQSVRKTTTVRRRSAVLNPVTTEEETQITSSQPTTVLTAEEPTETTTAPNEKYNIDCHYNYDGKLYGTKGTFSGLWEGLEQMAEKSDMGWAALKQWAGDTSEIRVCDYEEDNFKDINGYGTVNWSQGGHEWYAPYSISGSAGWHQAACGVCAVASVLSTLSGQAVTPPEVALAANLLIGESAWSGDIILTQGQAELIRLAGFRADTLPYTAATKEKMDDCLNSNGMVIFVTSSQKWASGGNHYIVVRNMKDNLYYTDDSGKNPTNGFTYDEISEGYNQQDVVYVYPKKLNEQ